MSFKQKGCYLTAAAQKSIDANKNYEWVHLNFTAPIPPTGTGSYNHLMWDIIRRRYSKDLLICKYFSESYQRIRETNCSAIYVGQPRICNFVKPYIALNNFISLGFNGHKKQDFLIQKTVSIIKHVNCKKILVWSNIATLPLLRRFFPNHTIAFAQRHYDYPLKESHHNDCDILIAQTRGQVSHAFQRMERLNPFVVVIPNGVELDLFCPPSLDERIELRLKLNLPKDKFIVIFPSKLTPHKGTYYLHKWITELCRSHSDVFFLVVGGLRKTLKSSHRNELEQLLTTSTNVRWVNNATREHMPSYYKTANVCLMPGLWREGFSMAAIEALASGLPLIASKAGFYPEIIRDGYNGFLCRQEFLFNDILKAIIDLKKNRALLEKMSKNSRLYAKLRLSREKVLSNFDAFLEDRYQDI